MGLVSIWLTHFTCLSIDVGFRYWLLSFHDNIMYVSQPCALVWMTGFFMLKYFPLFISLVEWFMLSALNVWMLYMFAYHGHDNLSHWQVCQLFCLSMSLCTITILLHLLFCASLYCWKFGWVCTIFSLYLYIEIVLLNLDWHVSCVVLLFGSLLWACYLADVSSIF